MVVLTADEESTTVPFHFGEMPECALSGFQRFTRTCHEFRGAQKTAGAPPRDKRDESKHQEGKPKAEHEFAPNRYALTRCTNGRHRKLGRVLRLMRRKETEHQMP